MRDRRERNWMDGVSHVNEKHDAQLDEQFENYMEEVEVREGSQMKSN